MKRTKTFAAAALAVGLAAIAATNAPVYGQAKGKELASTGTATIKGKVTVDGEVTPASLKPKFAGHKDEGHCSMGDTEDLSWVVGAGKGLANVVVFVDPPVGSYFKVDTSKKTWQDEVTIDQPFCNFKPHVTILFPNTPDGKPTGQKFKILNSAPILHNSRVAGNALKNPAKSETLAGKTGDKPTEKVFTLKSDKEVIKLNCDAHKWMEAYIWAFDHPYAALTREDGTFEIANVPAGATLSVKGWHESEGTKATERKSVTLKAGDTTEVNFSIKKK